jgi:hypothetical protein
MKQPVSKTSAFLLVTFAGFVGVAGFAVLMGLSLLQERDNRIEHALIETENMSRVLEGQAQATIQKVDIVIRNAQRHLLTADMKLAKGVRGRDTDRMQALLKEDLAAISEADVIHVANAAGDYIYSSMDPVPPINISDRAFFQASRDDPSQQSTELKPLQYISC